MKIIKVFTLLLFILLSSVVFGYNPKRSNRFSNYKDHTQEIGYAINLSYLRYQRALSPQLHFHYSRYLTNYFSLGVGYGGIYDKYFHNTFNLEVSFRFYHNLLFTLKPGTTVKNVNGEYIWLYSMAIGSNYEIKLSDEIHIGPTVEIGLLQDDFNYMVGFHMGFAF